MRNAGRGIARVFSRERNFRVQTAIGLFVGIAAFVFPLRFEERILVFVLIFSVMILEILNTVVETVVDIMKPRLHFQVEVVKDMMAGAVLFASFAAAFLGILIFGRHLL